MIWRKFKNFFYYLTLLLILTGLKIGEEKLISKEKRPTWVDHPQKGYFIGIGQHQQEGVAKEEALIDARKQIMDSLGVKISRDDIVEVTQKGVTSGIIKTELAGKTQSKIAAQTILKIQPEKWHIEKWQKKAQEEILYYWKAYVLVHFSESDYNSFIDNMIFETEKFSQNYFSKAVDEFNKKNFASAILNYNNAVESQKEIYTITTINPTKLSKLNKIKADTIISMNSFLSKIKLNTKNSNQKGYFSQPLEKPLAIEVYYEDVPVRGLTLRWEIVDGSGSLQETTITDSNGYSENKVLKIEPGEKKSQSIVMVKPELNEEFFTVPKGYYKIDFSKKIVVSFVSHDFEDNELGPVKGSIVNSIRNLGFTIVESNIKDEEGLLEFGKTQKADVAVFCKVRFVGKSLYENIFFVKAGCDLKIVRLQTGESSFQKYFESKGSGLDFNQARTKSIVNLAKIVENFLNSNPQEVSK